MAKLKAVVAKLEEVAESAREYYTAGDDGRFYLDAEGVDDMPAVKGLKAKRDELLGKVNDFKARFADIDPEEVKSIRTELADIKKGKGGTQDAAKIAELENRIQQLTQQAATEKAASSAEIDKERGGARRYFLRSEITRALAAQGGNPELLAHIVERDVKVDREGEDFKLAVVDKSGNPRIKNSMNEIVSLDDYVGELKANPKYAGAFGVRPASDNGGGSGNGGSGGGAASGTPKTIKSSDRVAISKNVRAIANGEITVVDG